LTRKREGRGQKQKKKEKRKEQRVKGMDQVFPINRDFHHKNRRTSPLRFNRHGSGFEAFLLEIWN